MNKRYLTVILSFFLFFSVFAKDNEALTLGNPSKAIADFNHSNNYLITHDTFSISYNNDKKIPNWVAWHLCSSDLGTGRHSGTFIIDPLLPKLWVTPLHSCYDNSGFDRGHLCPNADRNAYDNGKETFMTTNIVPQTPALNRIIWKALEDYCRKLVEEGNELYIYAGVFGVGGQNDSGDIVSSISDKKVCVPEYCWKVILILPEGENDLSRIDKNTKIIAVLMPNMKSCKYHTVKDYIVTCRYLEEILGYDFFDELPAELQNKIETKKYEMK